MPKIIAQAHRSSGGSQRLLGVWDVSKSVAYDALNELQAFLTEVLHPQAGFRGVAVVLMFGDVVVTVERLVAVAEEVDAAADAALDEWIVGKRVDDS